MGLRHDTVVKVYHFPPAQGHSEKKKWAQVQTGSDALSPSAAKPIIDRPPKVFNVRIQLPYLFQKA